MSDPANHDIRNLSRRRFLQGGAGLTLGFCLPTVAAAPAAGPGKAGEGLAVPGAFAPNAFVRIGTDDTKRLVRTLLAVDREKQSLTFAGDVPIHARKRTPALQASRTMSSSSGSTPSFACNSGEPGEKPSRSRSRSERWLVALSTAVSRRTP